MIFLVVRHKHRLVAHTKKKIFHKPDATPKEPKDQIMHDEEKGLLNNGSEYETDESDKN